MKPILWLVTLATILTFGIRVWACTADSDCNVSCSGAICYNGSCYKPDNTCDSSGSGGGGGGSSCSCPAGTHCNPNFPYDCLVDQAGGCQWPGGQQPTNGQCASGRVSASDGCCYLQAISGCTTSEAVCNDCGSGMTCGSPGRCMCTYPETVQCFYQTAYCQ